MPMFTAKYHTESGLKDQELRNLVLLEKSSNTRLQRRPKIAVTREHF